MIVTSMQLTISSRRDIAVLQKESSAVEGEEDVKVVLRQIQSAHVLPTQWPKAAPFNKSLDLTNSRF
jgi:hypothetical protein